MNMRVTFVGALAGLSILAAGCNGKSDGDGKKDGKEPVDTGGPDLGVAELFVNEIMASNTMTLQDEVGRFPDWIELYNPNDRAVELGGYWLTDDVDQPFKYEIPAGVQIEANGFLVFFADDDPEEGALHTSFNLDADGGEDVGLFGPDRADPEVVDSVEDMDPAVPDVSIARQPDGGATWAIEGGPTPGESNG